MGSSCLFLTAVEAGEFATSTFQDEDDFRAQTQSHRAINRNREEAEADG